MSTFEEFWPTVEPVVCQVANEYGRRHHVHGVDSGDFHNELVIWLIENEATVSEWLETMEPAEFDKYLAACLRNQSKDYGLDIKAQATGYERSDLYFYSKGELKELLASVFKEEKWHEPPQSEGRTNKSQAEGNNWVATLSDVSRAIGTLHEDDQSILYALHKDGYSNTLLAESMDVSEANMSYRYDRAITRLQKALGGSAPDMREQQEKRDPWRGRHAVGNSTARAMTGADYE